MNDIKFIREFPILFDKEMKRRGLAACSSTILDRDNSNREILTKIQTLQAERNKLSKQIGEEKKVGRNAQPMQVKVSELKEEISILEAKGNSLSEDITNLLMSMPNILHPDVPEGTSEEQNIELRKYGSIDERKFKPKEHTALGETLGGMHFERASNISGSRFVFLTGYIARLERALTQFMLDTHVENNGYTEVIPPLLVKDSALLGTGQLPKFAEDLYRTEDKLWLIPTAEVSLTNLVADTVLTEGQLPLRFVAFTPCFRREAGAAGRDTKGMIRQHQFEKVELVSLVIPENSEKELDRMTSCAEGILKSLELPYRVMSLCGGDVGFGASRTYDLEVWLPGQGKYREISSCSNCGPFQALRMGARFKPNSESKGNLPIHTLNGSGLAVGRTLVAVMENYQEADGSIVVPDVLKKYMGEKDIIYPDEIF
ncbi:MAG: serine--tRNA ligase [Rhodospirillaceae bacterium]|nr:serine--tRNA ligase [Rhodospirillaceae bacterium]